MAIKGNKILEVDHLLCSTEKLSLKSHCISFVSLAPYTHTAGSTSGELVWGLLLHPMVTHGGLAVIPVSKEQSECLLSVLVSLPCQVNWRLRSGEKNSSFTENTETLQLEEEK